jgi:hypothetical protein
MPGFTVAAVFTNKFLRHGDGKKRLMMVCGCGYKADKRQQKGQNKANVFQTPVLCFHAVSSEYV